MDQRIQITGIQYICNRTQFEIDVQAGVVDSLYKAFFDEMFLNTTTAPQLAQKLVLLVLGYIPYSKKHGYDGVTPPPRSQEVEEKMCMRMTQLTGKPPTGMTSTTINDPSQQIFDKYDVDKPLFVFPYFIDGHLIAIFSVEWNNLRQLYVDGLKQIANKIHSGKTSRSFSISFTSWNGSSTLAWYHHDVTIHKLLPKSILKGVNDAIKSGRIAQGVTQ